MMLAVGLLAVGCSDDSEPASGLAATAATTPVTTIATTPPTSASPTTVPTTDDETAPESTAPPPTDAATTTVETTTPPTIATTTTVAVEEFVPTLTDAPCPNGVPDAAQCHRVELPADWEDPNGDTVSLPVVVLGARGAAAAPDPIVIPAGGPGNSEIPFASYWSESPLNEERSIVLYDQRGTGLAEPSLECPEVDDANTRAFQGALPFDEERQAVVAAYLECRVRLETAGVDLDDYDTEASVKDLDAVRVALGFEEWNILGISYGARLTLAAMRSAPDGIRSVVLDSVYDVTAGALATRLLDAERSIAELVAGCAADPECAASRGDLDAKIDAVRARYNATPIEVDVDLDDGAGVRHFVITGDDIMNGLFTALYDAALIPALPGIIGALEGGDTTIVGGFLQTSIPAANSAADAMTVSVDCADNAELDDAAEEAAAETAGRMISLTGGIRCSEWPVEATSDTFSDPVDSDIPALALAGRFDPITPPAGTKAVADGLSNATFALWPNQGHGVTFEPCAMEIVRRFFGDPSAEVDLSCIDALTPPDFG